MLKNYIKVAWRNLLKYKGTTLSNMISLALGIASALIIFNVARYETSFDDFHKKADRIYRVNLYQETENQTIRSGYNYYPLGEAISSEVSGIENVTQMHFDKTYQYKIDQEDFIGEFGFYVDQEFFEVFDVEWVIGNPSILINDPQSIVISDRLAEKHFGSIQNAVGQPITYNGIADLVITGIVKSPPTNTDLPYSILIPYKRFETIYPSLSNNWETVNSGSTFIVKEEYQSLENIESQLESLVAKYLDQEIAGQSRFTLMYLNDNHDRNYEYNSFTYDFPVPILIIFTILAAILLLGGIINYVNLTIAQSFDRAKEIGIRKTIGSSRVQQFVQNLTETFVITCLTVLLAALITSIGLWFFNQRFNYPGFNINPMEDPYILLFLGSLIVVVVILAGLYPAIVLSKYKPLQALKVAISLGLDSKGRYQRFSLRKILITLQFTGSLLVIIISLVIFNQINYLYEKPLGFEMDEVIYVNIPKNTEPSNLKAFKAEVQKSAYFRSISYSDITTKQAKYQLSEKIDDFMFVDYSTVDENFISTLGIQLVAGKSFEASDENKIVINKEFCQKLEETPEGVIGKTLEIEGEILTVSGVVEDYYYGGVERSIRPFYLKYSEVPNMAFVRFEGVNQAAAFSELKPILSSSFTHPSIHFDMLDSFVYSFGFFNWFGTFFAIFGVLSILIGSMGLYGLVTFITLQKSKEIGIRKVLGATVSSILFSLNKQFLILLLIAFGIATPAGSMVGDLMLGEFANRAAQSLWIFVVAFLILAVTSFLSVMYKSLMAAIRNPVVALRYE